MNGHKENEPTLTSPTLNTMYSEDMWVIRLPTTGRCVRINLRSFHFMFNCHTAGYSIYHLIFKVCIFAFSVLRRDMNVPVLNIQLNIPTYP